MTIQRYWLVLFLILILSVTTMIRCYVLQRQIDCLTSAMITNQESLLQLHGIIDDIFVEYLEMPSELWDLHFEGEL